MRKGFAGVIWRAIKEGRLPWIIRQAGKYAAIEAGHVLCRGKALAGPLMGVLVITNECNSRCPMCDITSRPRETLTSAEARSIILQLIEAGSSGIGITGGEPLLRDDIFELTALARSFGIPVTLNTNGLLLNAEKIDALIKADPTNINISIDGGRAETHDKLRGGPFFEKTVAHIKELAAKVRERGSGMTVTVVSVISKTNYLELDELLKTVKECGAHRLGIMPLHNTRMGLDLGVVPAPELAGVPDKLLAQNEVLLDNSANYVRSLKGAFAGRPLPIVCNAAYTSLFVDCRRNVYGCLGDYMAMKPLAKLSLEKGAPHLKDIWYASEYRKKRLEMLKCRSCYLNCQAELSWLVRLLY